MTRKNICLCFIFLLSTVMCFAQLKVDGLLCENNSSPLGIDTKYPGFSWQLVSDQRNIMQSAYELQVSTDPQLKKAMVWKTGKVNSDSSVHVYYKGTPLTSGTRYYWHLRVWDNNGKESEWSAPDTWQMGLLNTSDWKAQWISPGYTEEADRPSPLFRKQFALNKKVRSAIAYVTAHGLYEAQINGQRVGDAYLTPGWTSYNKRLQYQTYDVTGLLKNGANAIGVTLGNGWYRGYLVRSNNHYGKDISLLFQLNVTYTDGTSEIIASDGTWKSSTGPIRYSEIYHGEIYDALMEKAGWTSTGYNDKDWSKVTVENFPLNNLIATCNEPVKKHETFKPVKIFTTPNNEKVIDFGQNIVGWVRVKLNGRPNDQVKIYHAEILDQTGNFYTMNLRSAKEENTYILKGGGPQVLSRTFRGRGLGILKLKVLAPN